jgi:glycosyltransferase involved in cell wall biosynthesis
MAKKMDCRVIFIKHGDCVAEYNNIYKKEDTQISDGNEPYSKEIIDFFKNKTDYRISIFSMGLDKRHFLSEENIELSVVKQRAHNKWSKFIDILKAQSVLLIYLLKRMPNKIIYIADLNYLLVVMVYSFFSHRKIFLFLPGSIEKHRIMNRLIVFAENLFSKVISRNKKNIDILDNLGYSRRGDIYYPKYSEIYTSNIIPTELAKDDNFKVLFIGRLTYVKGIDILEEVVFKTRNEDISFYIIGDGPCYRRLELIKRKNKLRNLHLLGFMPNRRIYSFISDSDVGFLPSKSEGVCKTALEFMLMETPVVASAVGGIPEIVEDGINGFLIEPNDINGFLQKFEQLKNDRDLVLHLKRGTLEAKKKILSFNKTFRYYLEIIFQ